MKRNAIIFDIDGTLADCMHRRHWVEGPKKNWDKFYEAMNEDKRTLAARCVPHFKTMFDACILYVTGRPEKYRKRTKTWLFHEIHADYYYAMEHLYMRPDDDYTPDDELKKKIYLEHIEPNFNVKLVLDDRDKVVRMWRSLGLECWQVADGNF